VDYFELVRKALEYLEMIGGICAFCKHVERVEAGGVVYCNVYGRVGAVIKCKNYEPGEAYEAISGVQGEIKAEKRESNG